MLEVGVCMLRWKIKLLLASCMLLRILRDSRTLNSSAVHGNLISLIYSLFSYVLKESPAGKENERRTGK